MNMYVIKFHCDIIEYESDISSSTSLVQQYCIASSAIIYNIFHIKLKGNIIVF